MPPKESHVLSFVSGKGIDTDCHAHPLSPRQVLIALSDTYANFNLPINTLRENILLQSDTGLAPSHLDSGDTLSHHGGVNLRITFPCEPCGRLNKTRPNLCRDIGRQRGWLARVVSGGVLRPGDRLQLTKGMYPRFSDDWHERVIAVARLLPEDRSLSYLNLALLAGVAKGYCRAFPRLLETHNLPTKRIVPSSIFPTTPFPEWSGEQLFIPELLSERKPTPTPTEVTKR
jgi:MOSC domain-containing protein YiiM